MNFSDRNDNNDTSGDIEDVRTEETEEISATSESETTPNDNADKIKELEQKYVRLAADFENYKKRQAKERADIIAYGNEEIIKALLNVLDNLERAIEHTDIKEDPKPLLDGVKLVHKQFLSCMEKFGVDVIDVKPGTEFDPRIHQAIERVVSDEFTPGIIISEMLKGYMLKDRLIRPSLVVVAKDEDKPSEEGNIAHGFQAANDKDST